jgi:hypothetical protein
MLYVSFSLSWEPTHPPTTQVSKLEIFLLGALQKKNSNKVFNKVLTIGFFPVANPNNVCKGFSLLLLRT